MTSSPIAPDNRLSAARSFVDAAALLKACEVGIPRGTVTIPTASRYLAVASNLMSNGLPVLSAHTSASYAEPVRGAIAGAAELSWSLASSNPPRDVGRIIDEIVPMTTTAYDAASVLAPR